MVALAIPVLTQLKLIPDINKPTRWGKQRRRYQVWLALLDYAKARKGGLPNKSGCLEIVRSKYRMSYTTFCEHFEDLEGEGLIRCETVGKSQTIYIPDAYWEPPEWVEG